MEAYEQRLYRSAPENPFVLMASDLISGSVSRKATLSVRVLISCILPSVFGKGIQSLFTNRLLTASSNSLGRLVAPMISTLSLLLVLAPSNSTRNSVFTRRELSCSPQLLELSRESISSMKMTLGCLILAIAKRVFTNFSLSPTHLLVSELALMLKKVADAQLAMALPIMVLPVPGGPKRRMARGGARMPVKMSGLSIGHTIISWMIFLAKPRPAIWLHFTVSPRSKISERMMFTSFYYRFLQVGSFAPSSYSFFSQSSLRGASGFLQGGTNFFLTEVPLGSELAEMNSPAGMTALAIKGISGL